MNGDELHALADRILRREVRVAENVSTRTAVFLLRLALEREVDAFWTRIGLPAIIDNSMRAQLICLGQYAGPGVSSRARNLWGQLSQACHYHSYELSPTADELRRWHDELGRLADGLDAAARRHVPSTGARP